MITLGTDGRVNAADLAALTGLTPRRVRQLANEGVVPYEKVSGTFRFDPCEAIPAYIERVKRGTPTSESDTLDRQKLRAEVDFRRAKAEQAQMELDELRGELHRSCDVERALDGFVAAARSALLAIPGRAAKDAFAARSEEECSQVLKREVHSAMAELSGYEYDPDDFAEMVRGRRGAS